MTSVLTQDRLIVLTDGKLRANLFDGTPCSVISSDEHFYHQKFNETITTHEPIRFIQRVTEETFMIVDFKGDERHIDTVTGFTRYPACSLSVLLCETCAIAIAPQFYLNYASLFYRITILPVIGQLQFRRRVNRCYGQSAWTLSTLHMSDNRITAVTMHNDRLVFADVKGNIVYCERQHGDEFVRTGSHSVPTGTVQQLLPTSDRDHILVCTRDAIYYLDLKHGHFRVILHTDRTIRNIVLNNHDSELAVIYDDDFIIITDWKVTDS